MVDTPRRTELTPSLRRHQAARERKQSLRSKNPTIYRIIPYTDIETDIRIIKQDANGLVMMTMVMILIRLILLLLLLLQLLLLIIVIIIMIMIIINVQ